MMKKFLTFIKKKPVIITAAAVVVVAVAVTCGVVAAMNGRENQPAVKSRSADMGEISSEAGEGSGASMEETSIEPETSVTGAEESTVSQNAEDPEASDEPATSTEPEYNAWLEGYVPTHPEPGEIDPELKREIQEFYAKKYNANLENTPGITTSEYNEFSCVPEDIIVSRYSGIYNGYAIVEIDGVGASPDVICHETLDETVLYYGDPGQRLYAYKDGNLYTLKYAYNSQLLAKSDIQDIGYYSGAAWRVNYTSMELN